eukprot:scaffold525_cov307-Pavlova_lutheri.AAC.9
MVGEVSTELRHRNDENATNRSCDRFQKTDTSTARAVAPGISASPSEENLRMQSKVLLYMRLTLVHRRRGIQARALPSRRLPHGPTESAFLDEDLPSQHRPTGKDMLGYPQRQVEPSPSNSHRPDQYPGPLKRTQPGRSPGREYRTRMENRRGGGSRNGQGVDTHSCPAMTWNECKSEKHVSNNEQRCPDLLSA